MYIPRRRLLLACFITVRRLINPKHVLMLSVGMVVLWYHTDVNMQQLNPPIPDHLMVLPNQIDRQFTANAHGEDDSTPKTAHMIRGPSTTKTKTAAPTRSASNTFSASAVLPTLNNESLAKELDHTLGKFAYGFVISACTKHSCLGYILNIITASHVLKQSGSKADIVLQVKMNSNTNGTMLAPEQELWIKKADVILKYTEKTRHDNFGLATIEKYRVLEWLEYDRVLFLDADILPLCNMDYLFVDSFNPDGALGELVSIQGAVAPMTASAFLVTPKPGEFDSVLDIIRRHRNRKDNATIFDPTIGWGYEMKARDMWMAWSKMGNNWNFYAASADQGVQYHWMRYEKLNYTRIKRGSIETWREVTDNADYWRSKTKVFEAPGGKFIAIVDETITDLKSCGAARHDRGDYAKFAPLSDYYHYSGWQKPWRINIQADQIPDGDFNSSFLGRKLWLWWFGQTNKTLDLGLPSSVVTQHGDSGQPLGDKSTDNDLLALDIELPRASK